MSTNLQQPKQRIQSIDILRGLVMLIMALDHVRDFFHAEAFTGSPTNMATTTPLLFFTRWITHFCAPTFAFLSGTSAWLAGRRKTTGGLGSFLIKRGLWLVFIELFVITLAFTFNPLYNLFILQVIWVIGLSMILLGLFVRTSLPVIIIVGCLLVLGHDVIDYLQIPNEGTEHTLMSLFFTAFGTRLQINQNHFAFDLYAILPWTGIMFLGYAFGSVFTSYTDAKKRNAVILKTGFAVTLVFIVLRLINNYGDPAPWSTQRNGLYTFLSFLNVSKYPPSLCYTTMTLGPALILLSFAEAMQSRFSNMLKMYGRVPFFYYVLHFYLIHIICVILFFATGYTSKNIVDTNTPFLFRPQNFGFGLGIVYLLWLLVIGILYKPCKWFDNYRKTHNQWWLSYL